MSRYQFDESRLRPGQKEAAEALVQREFLPKDERKTLDQIAEEIGTTRMSLYRWNNNDDNFIAYKNHIAAKYMDTNLAFVYNKLIEAIGRGSTKGIELYLKRAGDLDDRSEVTINDRGADKSFEERKAELLARLGKNDEK